MPSPMTSRLFALSFDAIDPLRLAHFWEGVLGWEKADDPHGDVALLPTDDTGFRLRFLPSQEQKAGPNQIHFDLTSTSLQDQQQTVAGALGLGARHIDIGQRPEEGHVVLADPEGNEFCVRDHDQETAIRSPHGGPKVTWGGPPVAPKIGKNRLHFDLAPSVDGDQQAEVERLVSLGATRVDIGQGQVSWVVMADPDGNEFCVLASA